MATTTTADPSPNHHSPRDSGFSDDEEVSSPKLPPKNSLTCPWAQVVRGDLESIPAVHHSPSSPSPSPVTCIPEQASFSDCSAVVAAAAAPESFDGNNGNAARPMKPAWKKPSNGVVETSPVMGADSWPSLSASTRASPKSSASASASADSSSKTVIDGSVPTSQGPVISHPPHPPQNQKQVTTTTNANPNSNHNRAARQRSGKRGGGGGGGGGNNNSSGGGPSQSSFTRPPPQSSFPHPPPPPPPPPPPFPIFPMPPNGYGNLVPAVPDTSPREPPYRGNNWETRPAGGFVSQSHTVNDHRHSSRRGNYGQRGDGSYHNHFGGRRDQDRGNYGNARDVHMQSHRAPPRGFVRPPPPSAGTFVPPQPVRPFGNHIGFPELLYVPTMAMEPFRGMPFITHSPPPPPAIIMPVAELPAMIVHQIEYYFSDANLVKDEYLKSNMDVQGWVPNSLIASFPRVKNLTNNIQLILDSLRTSTVVEVQDDKMRRRNEWMKWIHNSGRLPTESVSLSPGESSYDMLTTSVQKMTVDGMATNENSTTGKATPYSEDVPGRRSSELTDQSQLSNGEDTEGTSSSPN